MQLLVNCRLRFSGSGFVSGLQKIEIWCSEAVLGDLKKENVWRSARMNVIVEGVAGWEGGVEWWCGRGWLKLDAPSPRSLRSSVGIRGPER